MSELKKHNSIIFLTTLSVYLGLVLVGGASSPILAQAALTRNFDIQEEIEYKDDLDKKPDDNQTLLFGPTTDYFKDLEYFVEDLRKLHQIEKFNLNFDTFDYEESRNSECGLETIRRARVISNPDDLDKWLSAAIIDATRSFEEYGFIGDCLPNDDFENKKAVKSGLKIAYNKTSFEFKLTLTKDSDQSAKQLLNRYEEAYKTYKIYEDQVIVKQIYEHTSFKSENNQVFIITNLPRASIDSLFAEKDANQAASEK